MSAYCTGKAGEIARAMDGARAGPVEGLRSPLDTRIYQSTHLVGVTIMGMDPSTSVVSPRLQHWNAENLFVAGASAVIYAKFGTAMAFPWFALVGSSTVFAVGLAASLVVPDRAKTIVADPLE